MTTTWTNEEIDAQRQSYAEGCRLAAQLRLQLRREIASLYRRAIEGPGDMSDSLSKAFHSLIGELEQACGRDLYRAYEVETRGKEAL